jgi:hypothetical protein
MAELIHYRYLGRTRSNTNQARKQIFPFFLNNRNGGCKYSILDFMRGLFHIMHYGHNSAFRLGNVSLNEENGRSIFVVLPRVILDDFTQKAQYLLADRVD